MTGVPDLVHQLTIAACILSVLPVVADLLQFQRVTRSSFGILGLYFGIDCAAYLTMMVLGIAEPSNTQVTCTFFDFIAFAFCGFYWLVTAPAGTDCE